MITEYPPEDHRYDSPEYEPLWAAAQDLNMPVSLHTATSREGRDEGGRCYLGQRCQCEGQQGVFALDVYLRHDLLGGFRALS